MVCCTGGIAIAVIKGPLEAIAGVAYGIFFGVLSWYLPHKRYVSPLCKCFMNLTTTNQYEFFVNILA